jgi:hypothetical protein
MHKTLHAILHIKICRKKSARRICQKNLRKNLRKNLHKKSAHRPTRTAYLVSVHHAVFADRDQHGHVGHGGRVLGRLARRGVGGGLGGGAATMLSGGRSGRWQDRGEVETKESMHGQKYKEMDNCRRRYKNKDAYTSFVHAHTSLGDHANRK